MVSMSIFLPRGVALPHRLNHGGLLEGDPALLMEVFLAYLLLGGLELGDVGVGALLHVPEEDTGYCCMFTLFTSSSFCNPNISTFHTFFSVLNLDGFMSVMKEIFILHPQNYLNFSRI